MRHDLNAQAINKSLAAT